jgi:PII-like signaling protein
MKLEGEQTLLRVYLRNTDRHGWFAPPAAEALVRRARQAGLAGATVLRGFFGLDVTGRLLESHAWSLVDHVPVVVEIVDSPAAIGRFLAVVAELVHEGLATMERVHVMLYRRTAAAAGKGTGTICAEHPSGLRQMVPVPFPAAAAAERSAMRLAVPAPPAPGSTLPAAEEFPVMHLSESGQLLRVFIGESDVWQGMPLYRAIVLKARELGLAGATVLRGPMGFGANSRVHTTALLELSKDLPIVVEIVDAAQKVEQLLPFLDEAVAEGLITLEGVRVLRYRANAAKAQ